MDKKDVSLSQFNEFWDLFNKKHPDIDSELPPTRALVAGNILCNKPARMPEERYDIYFRFLKRWYMDNDFIPFEPDMVFVALDGKIASLGIDTSTITSIEKIDNERTRVVFNNLETGIIENVVIKENIDYFKSRVYIF